MSPTSPTAAQQAPHPTRPKSPPLPPHNAPRVWFITSGASPVGIGIARQALKHGDCVVAAIAPELFQGKHEDASEQNGGSGAGGDGQGAGGPNGDGEAGGNVLDGADELVAEFASFVEELRGLVEEGREHGGVLRRLRVVRADLRVIAQCQAAIAEALEVFGRIDIVLGCSNETILGSVEELTPYPRLVRDQFETNYFLNVSIIRAVLPSMRARRNGHIIMLTGTTGNLGTPGLSVYCASQWAIEGFCDSLAYEVAPFNIKMTIVQPNTEVGILSNRITAVPVMEAYTPDQNPAPLARDLIGGMLEKLSEHPVPPGLVAQQKGKRKPRKISSDDDDAEDSDEDGSGSEESSGATPRAGNSPQDTTMKGTEQETRGAGAGAKAPLPNFVPVLPAAVKKNLVAETVYALLAIGGHDNPPARHIVGFEAVVSTKEKLKTTSEELEDFIEVSAGVDITEEEELGVLRSRTD